MRRPRSKEDAPSTLKLPHDPLNERIVLAAAMTDPVLLQRLTKRLPTDRFFIDEKHKHVWNALVALESQSLSYSPGTVSQLSGGAVTPEELQQIQGAVALGGQNIDHHVEQLEWDITRIKAAEGPLNDLLDALQNPTTTKARMRALSRAVGSAFDIGSTNDLTRGRSELVNQTVADLQHRMSGIACYEYGIPDLDCYEQTHQQAGQPRLVPGAHPGGITVVTAVSGSGKSTLCGRIGLGIARKKRRVLFGAWEMGSEKMLELLAAMSLNMDRTKVTKGAISQPELAQLKKRMEQIAGWVRFVDMPFHKQRGRRVSHDEVLDVIHGLIIDNNAEVAIFDLFRRAFRGMREVVDEEEALYRIQAIAEETQCHCILVAQQRLKDVEKRADRRPTREGIKGTSAWVDVADTILGVHMPALWKNVPDNQVEVMVLKQRYAPWPQLIQFDYDAATASFTNGISLPFNLHMDLARNATFLE